MAYSNPVVLFDKKEECCACGACMNICPQNAISMQEDEFGFLYPQIDNAKCIRCGACKNVCAYQNTEPTSEPLAVYAAINSNKVQKITSASGGLFAAFATKIINDGGIVYGCSLEIDGNEFVPRHISIDSLNQLYKLQGSKYVQSTIGFIYKEVLENLKRGRKVLFSGTPCQVAGLKEFLKKDYENLVLVDVICHGVPNARFFNDYLESLRKRKGWERITGYSFRDKRKGWGMNCRIDAVSYNRQPISHYIPARLASYNTLFLDGHIYRDNCYSCKYACSKRAGDITIGDYWGITSEHPEIIDKNGFEEKFGISCMMANNKRGLDFSNEMEGFIIKEVSTFEKVSQKNEQLKKPFTQSSKREKIMQVYFERGYEGIEKLYRSDYRKQRVIHYIFNKLPRNIRNNIKKIKG